MKILLALDAVAPTTITTQKETTTVSPTNGTSSGTAERITTDASELLNTSKVNHSVPNPNCLGIPWAPPQEKQCMGRLVNNR